MFHFNREWAQSGEGITFEVIELFFFGLVWWLNLDMMCTNKCGHLIQLLYYFEHDEAWEVVIKLQRWLWWQDGWGDTHWYYTENLYISNFCVFLISVSTFLSNHAPLIFILTFRIKPHTRRSFHMHPFQMDFPIRKISISIWKCQSHATVCET